MITAVFQSPEIIWNGTLFNKGLWIFGLVLGLFGMIIPVFLFTIAVPKVGLGMSSILSINYLKRRNHSDLGQDEWFLLFVLT